MILLYKHNEESFYLFGLCQCIVPFVQFQIHECAEVILVKGIAVLLSLLISILLLLLLLLCKIVITHVIILLKWETKVNVSNICIGLITLENVPHFSTTLFRVKMLILKFCVLCLNYSMMWKIWVKIYVCEWKALSMHVNTAKSSSLIQVFAINSTQCIS